MIENGNAALKADVDNNKAKIEVKIFLDVRTKIILLLYTTKCPNSPSLSYLDIFFIYYLNFITTIFFIW